MNQFLNTQTNLMSLQFGYEKCVKMHIGKECNKIMCSNMTVDAWKEELQIGEEGKKVLKDKFVGRELMKNVDEKAYLGDIVSKDGKNVKNIKNRTNKAFGNINKIISTLKERPLGKHTFKAFKLMREGLLLGGLLTNAESWINISKRDIEQLEKPDTILQKKALSAVGNPSKAFTMLELGLIPVRYILMKKRMLFLQYILKEDKDSMIYNVFKALNEDSRKGDFVDLVNRDRNELKIDLLNEEIEKMSVWMWKKLVNSKVKEAAFEYLTEENNSKEKTKDINFSELKMSEYLEKNMNTSISKVIFGVRSKTLDIKEYNAWKYKDSLCVMCRKENETIEHFVKCVEYGDKLEIELKHIYGESMEEQIIIGKFIDKRQRKRGNIIKQQEDGQASNLGSTAPGIC